VLLRTRDSFATGRGWVTVLDRIGLENAASGSYQVLREVFNRLLP
jgi:hypothetical protein